LAALNFGVFYLLTNKYSIVMFISQLQYHMSYI